MNFPVAVMSAKPWMPLVTSREPVKEFDPVLVEVKVPSVVMLPEIEAAPPTSNFVSMLAPALMPTLPLVLKTVSPMVVVASVMVKVKPAEAMVVLASKVRESDIAVKFNGSAVRSALSILVMVLPVPLAAKEKPVRAPSVPMSQSDVLTEPTSPLSPRVKTPFKVVEPLTLKSPPAVIEPVAWTPLVTSRPPEKEFEPVLDEVMIPARVRVPETEAVPPTSSLVLIVPPALMPTLPLVLKMVSPMVVVASVMVKVKPAEAMVVLASKVRESEIAVKSNVSAVRSALSILVMVLPVPLASKEKPVRAPSVPMSQSDVLTEPTSPLSPRVKTPFKVVEPLTLKSPPAVIEPVAWTPLVTSRLPEKEFEPVLDEVMIPARVRVPETEAVPPTSSLVLIVPPALMPTLPLVLKMVSPMVVVASVMVKVKPAEAMVVLASKVRESEIAVKSNVSAVRSALSILVMVLPVPLASKEKP